MDFASVAEQEAMQRAEVLVRQLVNNYGFEEQRAREATMAIGASSCQNAINWLLDHGEEDRGGSVILKHCSHTDKLEPERLVNKNVLTFGLPCAHGCTGSENWICLFCGETRCSRYQHAHALEHYNITKANAEQAITVGDAARGTQAIGHHLAISLADLSVWCYECDAYIDPSSGRNPVVKPLVQRLEALKFGTQEPEVENGCVSHLQAGDELHGSKESLHGSKGCEAWAAPRVAAVADQLARPGYQTCIAHEYHDTPEVLNEKVKLLAELVCKAQRTVAYTGAGISTAAGISDYATKTEINTGNSPQIASPYDALPTAAHKVLVALHRTGRLDRWVQQNHDGLPQKAGYPQHKLNEIHGAWFDPSNPVVPMDGTLREDLMQQLIDWEDDADLVLAFGSTLCGMNADRICTSAANRARAGKPHQFGLVIANLQQTQYDHLCSVRIFARLDDVLLALAKEMQLQVEENTPQPLEGDVFEVPYDEAGKRATSCSKLDLRPGAQVRFVRQPEWDARRAGTLATVVGRTQFGDWELELATSNRRRLGAWWVREALQGSVDCLPIINYQAT